MTYQFQFTVEIAHAIAADYLKRNEMFTPPIGITTHLLISGMSTTVVLDIRKFDNPDVFGMAFIEMVAHAKLELRACLVKSGWAESHREVGFQFNAYPSDEQGHPAVDLASNQNTAPFGVALVARLFAEEIV